MSKRYLRQLLILTSIYFISISEIFASKNIAFNCYVPSDTIRVSEIILPAEYMLGILLDSTKRCLNRSECPQFLYDECLDYRKFYSLYNIYVWDTSNTTRNVVLCSHCIYEFSSLKKEIIDSLDKESLLKILQISDTIKLNVKCSMKKSKQDFSQICIKYSTLDLIKRRLEELD